jgi:hypothetical protein
MGSVDGSREMRRGEKRRAIPRPFIMMAVVAVAAVALLGGAVTVLSETLWG